MRILSLCAALAVFVWTAAPTLAQAPAPKIGETVNQRQEVKPIVAPTEAPDAPVVEEDMVEAAMRSFSLAEKVAQLMLVRLGGVYSPNNDDRILFQNLPPGGVVIPEVAKPSDAAAYTTALRSLPIEQEKKVPLFIGCNVYSLTQHDLLDDKKFLQLPSMLSLAAADDENSTRALAELIARYLTSMGFNLHLGPSLELSANLPGAKGSVHTFGGNPATVASTGALFHATLLEKGILTIPSGFPGGGGNRVGGGAAVLMTPKPMLLTRDYVPYIASIASGAKMLLVGNTLAPMLDPTSVPSCTSRVVVTEVLRGQLGFTGVIIGGPIDVPDVTTRFDATEATIRALRAGVDMVYVTEGGRRVAAIVGGVVDAVAKGELSEETIDAAFRRIVTLKRDQGLIARPLSNEKDSKTLENDMWKLDQSYHIERRSITLIQNTDNILPLTKERSMPIGVTGVAGVDELHEALEEYIKKIVKQPITTASHIGRVQSFEIERITRNVKGLKTAICVLSNDVAAPGQVQIVRGLKEKGSRVVVVLLGYPELAPAFREADAIVVAYTSTMSTDQTMRAVADVLVGQGPVDVLSGVRDLTAYKEQDLSFDAMDVIRTPMGRLPITLEEPYVAGYSVAYDPARAFDKMVWDFGDGEQSKDPQTTHAYKQTGRYPVTLTVKDKTGQWTAGTFHVVVE